MSSLSSVVEEDAFEVGMVHRVDNIRSGKREVKMEEDISSEQQNQCRIGM